MNDLIKELAEQATEYATTRHPLSNHIVLSVNSEKFEERFALLLMREIAMVQITHQATMDLENKKMDDPAKELNYAVIEHFGVGK
jgi:hypothetical protein